MTQFRMDRFQTFNVVSRRRTGGIGWGQYLSMAQELSLWSVSDLLDTCLVFFVAIQYALISLINLDGERCGVR